MKLNYFGVGLNSEICENKVSPNFGFVFVLHCFKVFRLGKSRSLSLGKLTEYAHHAAREKAATVFFMSPILGRSER